MWRIKLDQSAEEKRRVAWALEIEPLRVVVFFYKILKHKFSFFSLFSIQQESKWNVFSKMLYVKTIFDQIVTQSHALVCEKHLQLKLPLKTEKKRKALGVLSLCLGDGSDKWSGSLPTPGMP